MLNLTKKLEHPVKTETTLTLPFEIRQKSRFRATLDDGREAGIILSRGEVLRSGDCLESEQGEVVQICAADETVSIMRTDDALMLARAAYHLGNRHVPLQITVSQLCYQHDHVLDEMLEQLGLKVTCEQAPFEPEAGAYSGGGHSHGHHHHHD